MCVSHVTKCGSVEMVSWDHGILSVQPHLRCTCGGLEAFGAERSALMEAVSLLSSSAEQFLQVHAGCVGDLSTEPRGGSTFTCTPFLTSVLVLLGAGRSLKTVLLSSSWLGPVGTGG